MGPDVACLDAVSSAEHPRAPLQLSGPPVPERPLCAPHPGCSASPVSSVRGQQSSPLGAGAAPGAGWPPHSSWQGWHSTSLLSEIPESPRLAAPGAFTGSRNLKQSPRSRAVGFRMEIIQTHQQACCPQAEKTSKSKNQ